MPSASTAAKSAGLSATELVYQPMLQAISYLRANGFKTYIVIGGGQEFVRAYARKVYGVPPEQVAGSSLVTKFETAQGKREVMRPPKLFLDDDHAGKDPTFQDPFGCSDSHLQARDLWFELVGDPFRWRQ